MYDAVINPDAGSPEGIEEGEKVVLRTGKIGSIGSALLSVTPDDNIFITLVLSSFVWVISSLRDVSLSINFWACCS